MGAIKVEQKKQAIELFYKGIKQYQIAEILKVRPATISEWLKPVVRAEKSKEKTIENLSKRLQKLSENPNTPLSELDEITELISKIKNN